MQQLLERLTNTVANEEGHAYAWGGGGGLLLLLVVIILLILLF